MTRKPWCMTSVQNWTQRAPTLMNSTASRHEDAPPVPRMGMLTLRAISAIVRSVNGLIAGPVRPLYVDLPPSGGFGTNE